MTTDPLLERARVATASAGDELIALGQTTLEERLEYFGVTVNEDVARGMLIGAAMHHWFIKPHEMYPDGPIRSYPSIEEILTALAFAEILASDRLVKEAT